MKKLLICAICAAVLAGSATFAEETKNDTFKFRGHEWGDSLEQVKTDEGLKDEDEGVTYYINDSDKHMLTILDGEVAEHSANMYFHFTEDWKLSEGQYVFTDKHVDSNKYYDDFCDIEEKLTSLYGEPGYSNEFWSNDLYKDRPEDVGTAIGAGHVIFGRGWRAEDGSTIIMTCNGDNFKINVGISYQPPIGSYSSYKATSDTDGL